MEHFTCFVLAFGGAFLGAFVASLVRLPASREVKKRAPTYNTPGKAASYLKGIEDNAKLPERFIRP